MPLPAGEPAPLVGDDRPGWTDDEAVHQAAIPTAIYPLFEAALRAAAGRGLEEHRRVVSELWARFAAVSGTRAAAWSQKAWSAEEIRTPSPANRMVTYPYTKLMCANIFTDQAAAVLVCSPEAARAAGVRRRPARLPPRRRRRRRPAVLHRAVVAGRVSRDPGDRPATRLAAAGVGVDDIARFDLYSCFPSAVQMAMKELGLAGPAGGDDRPLTVTGGLSFFGGPGNNYVTHSVAAMVDACRADPGLARDGDRRSATSSPSTRPGSTPPARRSGASSGPTRRPRQAKIEATPARAAGRRLRRAGHGRGDRRAVQPGGRPGARRAGHPDAGRAPGAGQLHRPVRPGVDGHRGVGRPVGGADHRRDGEPAAVDIPIAV